MKAVTVERLKEMQKKIDPERPRSSTMGAGNLVDEIHELKKIQKEIIGYMIEEGEASFSQVDTAIENERVREGI